MEGQRMEDRAKCKEGWGEWQCWEVEWSKGMETTIQETEL